MKHLLIIISIIFIREGFAKEVIVYSSRKDYLIKPLFDKFTDETGIKVKYLTNKAGVLLQKLKSEKDDPTADLFITVDVGNLWRAEHLGLLESATSGILYDVIPPYLRSSKNTWFGLSIRARTIVYHPDRVSPKELSSYEDLSTKKWKNRLVLRTSKKVYNQSLVAMMLFHLQKSKTSKVIRGWVKNLALPPLGSDTEVIKSIAAGKGDVGIVNSYYLARLIAKNPNYPVKLFWSNQESYGTHINISGVGFIKNAPHKKEAIQLMEWLATEGQKLIANENFEYPVNKNVELPAILKDWDSFIQDKSPIEIAGEKQKEAIFLMDKYRYR